MAKGKKGRAKGESYANVKEVLQASKEGKLAQLAELKTIGFKTLQDAKELMESFGAKVSENHMKMMAERMPKGPGSTYVAGKIGDTLNATVGQTPGAKSHPVIRVPVEVYGLKVGAPVKIKLEQDKITITLK